MGMDNFNANRNEKALKRKIKNIHGDMTHVGPKIGNIIARHARRNFATKGAHFGEPWKPLKASTIKQKLKGGFTRQPLVRTGDLKAGLTKSPMDKEYYAITFGVYGTGQQVAKWQQLGTFRKGKRAIPPRILLKVTPEMRRDVVDLIRKRALGKRR